MTMLKKIVLLAILVLCPLFTHAYRTAHVGCKCPVEDVKGKSCSCTGGALTGTRFFHIRQHRSIYIALHCNQELKQHKISPAGNMRSFIDWDENLRCLHDYTSSGKHHETYYCFGGGAGNLSVKKIRCEVGGGASFSSVIKTRNSPTCLLN
jgi:hypothetical protein